MVFGIIQACFSGSTKQWGLFENFLSPNVETVKKISNNQWHAHSKSVYSVDTNYDKIAGTEN